MMETPKVVEKTMLLLSLEVVFDLNWVMENLNPGSGCLQTTTHHHQLYISLSLSLETWPIVAELKLIPADLFTCS